MVVLESLPGVEVTINCRGTKLPEYDDMEETVEPSLKHKTVTKYIQSLADDEFSIVFSVGTPYKHDCESLGFYVCLDGRNEPAGHLCERKDLEDFKEWESELLGQEINKGAMIEKFKFSELVLTDDNIGHLSKKVVSQMQNIGLIEVKVYQMGPGRKVKRRPQKTKVGRNVVPEKIIKGRSISHNISYGRKVALPELQPYKNSDPMHGWDGYIANFRFKYRSRGDLQKEFIIPRSPSPGPPKPRGVEALTQEEKLRLAHMKYADTQMLKALTAPAWPGHELVEVCRLEDLTEDEINLLAKQKHAEMTGGMFVKCDPSIKNERDHIDLEMDHDLHPKVKLDNVLPLANGKIGVDLTGDSETEYTISRLPRPKARTGSDWQNDESDDEISIIDVRPVKRARTRDALK